jgi:hypothetical protein
VHSVLADKNHVSRIVIEITTKNVVFFFQIFDPSDRPVKSSFYKLKIGRPGKMDMEFRGIIVYPHCFSTFWVLNNMAEELRHGRRTWGQV